MKTTTFLAIGFLAFPAFASAATFNTSLYYGIQDKPDVIALQEFLTTQGDFTGQATGNFYSLTLAAVKAFQVQNGIQPVSGYFGVLSRGVANTLLAPVAPIEETGTTTTVITPPPTPVQQPIPVTIIGNTPVNNTPVVQTPVVQSPVMNEPVTPVLGATQAPAWKINVTQDTNTVPGGVQPRFTVNVYDANGVYTNQAVTVTTDDPDLPPSFIINEPQNATLDNPNAVQWFCVGNYDGFPGQGCKSTAIPTPGTYNFTFTVDTVSVTKQVTI